MESNAATADGPVSSSVPTPNAPAANASPTPAPTPAPTTYDTSTYDTVLLFDTEDGKPLSPPRRRPITATASLAKALVRAAEAGRSDVDPPLTFSSLLVAMLVDEDAWLQRHFESQGVRFDEIAAHRRYDEASLRSLNAGSLESEYLTTTSARAALEEAIRIAALTSAAGAVDLRHLCAAYPVLTNWHLADFQRFEIDRLEWARAFGAEMARRYPKERHYWGSYADRASPVPLTSFSADVYTEEDLLGIDRSVDALALLIASTRTVTPLAIGVFGPWGSGKSFFMRHLQRRIVGLRKNEGTRIKAWQQKRDDGTAQAADAPLYFGDIAQVEFNAWHYNEGNLVASLVEHLFRNLRVEPEEADKVLAERRTEVLRKLDALQSNLQTVGQTIDDAEKDVDAAKANVAQASQAAQQAREGVRGKADEIERQKDALADEHRKLDDALRALEPAPGNVDAQAAIAVALGPLAPLLDDLRATLASIRDQAFDWKGFVQRVCSPKGLVVIALCLVAPLVLWLTRLLEAQWASLVAAIPAAFGAFGAALDVLKERRALFESKLKELEATQQRRLAGARAAIEARAAELKQQSQVRLDEMTKALDVRRRALAEQEERLAAAAQALAARAQEHDARLSERVEAEAKVVAAEAELKRLSSALLLEEFIKDRLSTDEYRKQLGFLALVRRDIERLSHLIDAANKDWLDTAGGDKPSPLLNRIVLYIDDLDRCKETTVLAVLEAVHLLLAFPLFVCAVAVDPRWVESCLRAAHSQLFADDEPRVQEARPVPSAAAAGNATDAATPRPGRSDGARLTAPATVGDYLEKIFQIPIWMAPIESRTRAALVNTLLGPTASPQPRRTGQTAQVAAETAASAKPAADPEEGALKALVSKARETPDPLQISAAEAGFIDEIAVLLSDRPRALKRLVNIYRLLKASLPDIERASFVDAGESSAYRICLTQLALFTSHPRLAPTLVAAIGEPEEDADPVPDDGLTLESWLLALPEPVEPDLATAIRLLPNRGELLLGPFRRWLPYTSRHLFHRAG